MLKTVIKIAVVLLLLKELWLLLQIPSVFDAIASFVMVGQLPGTSVYLSPDQMYKLLALAFIVIASLIFCKEIATFVRWLLSLRKRPQIETPESVEPQAEQLADRPVEIEAPAVASAVNNRGYIRLLPMLRYDAERMIARIIIVTSPRARGAYLVAHEYAIRGSAKAWVLAQQAGRFAWRMTCVICLRIKLGSIGAWHWSKPRIERFDRWIEKKLRQNEQTAAMLTIGKDMQRTMSKWWSDFKAANKPMPTDEITEDE
ncbi:MAG TPA: hypothetical protein VF809_01895 [Candidatus Saccharimonadales bacterium]